MQDQAPGYVPPKIQRGVRFGNRTVKQTSKPAKKGKKTTVTNGLKSTAFNQQIKQQQPVSNNLPGFNAPGAAPFL